MSYTAYVGIFVSAALIMWGSRCFLRYQDRRYEEEMRQKEEEKKEEM